MPNKCITILGLSCGAVFAAYVGLVIATIFFASWETQLAASAGDAEARIAALETQYYDGISALNSTNIASAGYTHPAHVEYVAESGSPTFTFAPNATR